MRYTSSGTVLTAQRCGTGTPVLLLHGSGLDDHRAFDGLAEILADAYMVLAVDVRGYGLSSCADPDRHTWEQYAMDVLALLDHLKLPKAVVGGYSLGSGISVATAVRYPSRVAALLLGWPAYAGRRNGLTMRQRVAWKEARAHVSSVRRFGLRATLAGTQDRPLDPHTERRLATQDERSLLAALDGELATHQPFDSEDQLRAIVAPALIVPGLDAAHDPLIAAMYARCLPHATTVRGEQMSPLGDTERVRAFLDGLDNSTG